MQSKVSGMSAHAGAGVGQAGGTSAEVSQSLQDVKGYITNLQGDIRTLLSRSPVSLCQLNSVILSVNYQIRAC